jgi:hypothetical protein
MDKKDLEEIGYYMKGSKLSIMEFYQSLKKEGEEIPETISFLVKTTDGYRVGGGIPPTDFIMRKIHDRFVDEMVESSQGGKLISKVESVYTNGKVKIKYTNYLTNEITEELELIDTVTPFQTTNIDLVSDIPFCLN